MTSLPNASQTLLKVASLFDSPGWQAAERTRFASLDMRLEMLQRRGVQLIKILCEALSLSPDSPLWNDFDHQLKYPAKHLDAHAIHTSTFGADARQILWILFGFDLAPRLGRTWGFWCRAYPVSMKLVGGNLWFLPRIYPEDQRRLILPVEAVARWWLGLLEGPIEDIWKDVEDDRHRTFRTWLSGDVTPTPAKLRAWFSDDQSFDYGDGIGPSTQDIRRLFICARALETGWKDLVATLTPDVDPHVADPMRNKALQLVELFRLAYEVTIAPQTDDPTLADVAFRNALPEWLARGPFHPILFAHGGELSRGDDCAKRLSLKFMELTKGAPLQDIFQDAAYDGPAEALIDASAVTEREQMQQCLEAGLSAWHSTHPDRARIVRSALAQARHNPRSAEFEADILCLEALDRLSRGDFEAAGKILDHGMHVCATGSFGSARLDIARLSLGLSVAGNAFNQNEFEAAFRVILMCPSDEEAVHWDLGVAPIEYSMRQAAVELSDRFWKGAVKPYPGVRIDHPLTENDSIFKEFFHLLDSHADEPQLQAFLRKHKTTLKRKLHDVRGDTFFLMTMKMVHGRAAQTQACASFPIGHVLATQMNLPTYAASLRKTHNLLASLLPTDGLNARDYLGQTPLMLAADHGNGDLVRILIEKRVDLDAQDALGRTALHAAVKANSVTCFALLLGTGANSALKTFDGKTPAVLAAQFGREQIFKQWRAHLSGAVTEEDLRHVHSTVLMFERSYERTRAEHRLAGTEVGDRNAYGAIIAASALPLAEGNTASRHRKVPRRTEA